MDESFGMNGKLQCQQLNLSSYWKQKARAEFQTFEPVYHLFFLEELRRLAQCSGSETLRGFFFLVRFSFDLSKEK